MNILFIINPISGGIDKRDFIVWLQHEKTLDDIRKSFYFTTGDQDERYIKLRIEDTNPDKIIVVGGDGTLLLVGKLLITSKIPLGIVPGGSANGMASELNIPTTLKEAAIYAIRSSKTIPIDLLLFNDEHYGIHIADTGLNAEIIKGFSEEKERGILSYAKHFFQSISNSTPIKYEVFADDLHHELHGYMLAMANAKRYGTGLVLNPNGNLSDGKFELCLVKSIDPEDWIQAGLSKLILPEEKFEECVEVIQCTKAHIHLPSPKLFQIDGEIIGDLSEISIEVISGAINLIDSTSYPN